MATPQDCVHALETKLWAGIDRLDVHLYGWASSDEARIPQTYTWLGGGPVAQDKMGQKQKPYIVTASLLFSAHAKTKRITLLFYLITGLLAKEGQISLGERRFGKCKLPQKEPPTLTSEHGRRPAILEGSTSAFRLLLCLRAELEWGTGRKSRVGKDSEREKNGGISVLIIFHHTWKANKN